MCALTTTSSDD